LHHLARKSFAGWILAAASPNTEVENVKVRAVAGSVIAPYCSCRIVVKGKFAGCRRGNGSQRAHFLTTFDKIGTAENGIPRRMVTLLKRSLMCS